MKNPFKATTTTEPTMLEHDGTPDCAACKAETALGKAITRVINDCAILNGHSKIEVCRRMLAIGIASEARDGKAGELTAVVCTDLINDVGQVLVKTGRLATEATAVQGLSKRLTAKRAIGYADDNDMPLLSPTSTTKH